MLKSPAAIHWPEPASLTAAQRRWAWALALAGAVLRLVWVIVIHPPQLHVYSDMAGYIDRAGRLFQPGGIGDTLYPPGTSMLLGLLGWLDPAMNLAVLVWWGLSLLVLALVWAITRTLYGNTAALIALGLAAFYPPLTHYAGLFLAELPFMATLLLTFWAGLRTIAATEVRGRFGFGVLTGLAFVLVASFKNTVFVPFVLTAVGALAWAIRGGRPWRAAVFGIVVGTVVLMAPLTVRCTHLNEGRACLSANNIGMNVLMGHYGRNGPYRWHDAARNIVFEFTSPSASLRGYTPPVDLDFGAYDNAANLRLAWEWTRAHPAASASLGLDAIVDLYFSHTLWPFLHVRGHDLGRFSQWLFWLLILPPALLWCGWRLLRRDATTEALLLLPQLGVVLTVFVSIGETRHRVPFDPLWIVLAAAAYAAAARRLGALSGFSRWRAVPEISQAID